MGEVENRGDLLRILNQGKGARSPASGPAITPALRRCKRPRPKPERCSKCSIGMWRGTPTGLHATVLQDDSTVIATLSYAGLAGRRRR